MTDPQSPIPPTNTGEGTIVGGPLDNTGTAPEASTPPPAPPSPPKTNPIYVGGKKFETQDEMISYFSELEAKNYAQQQQVQQPVVRDVEKELSELMFEDPAAYNRAMLEMAETRALEKIRKQEDERSVMDRFYSQNPDLKDDKDIVGLVYQQNAQKLGRMHLDQAMDELATAARGRLSKLRQIPSGGTQLPSGPAITTGSSGGPGVQPVVTQKTLTFVEQMEAIRQKRRKA